MGFGIALSWAGIVSSSYLLVGDEVSFSSESVLELVQGREQPHKLVGCGGGEEGETQTKAALGTASSQKAANQQAGVDGVCPMGDKQTAGDFRQSSDGITVTISGGWSFCSRLLLGGWGYPELLLHGDVELRALESFRCGLQLHPCRCEAS